MVTTDAQMCGDRYSPDVLHAWVCDQQSGHVTDHMGPAVAWDADRSRPGRAAWPNLRYRARPDRTDAETLAMIRLVLPEHAEIGRPGNDAQRLSRIRELLFESPENDSAPRYGDQVGETGE